VNVLDLVLFICETAWEVIKGKLSGSTVDVPGALIRIVNAGYQAYEKETGQPLDPAKIKPFEPIPE
jgi:hypothetical protein